MSNESQNKFSIIDIPELPPSVDNALQNLTDEPTKNVGQTFGDLWYLVFGGLSHAADKKRMKYAYDLQTYNRELNSAIERIPENKKTEPSIQVTAQALENSKYCISSQILRQMFVKLISGTMHQDLEPSIHPSFPEILKQMSENDALILRTLTYDRQIPIANICLKSTNGTLIHFAEDVCYSPLDQLSDEQYMISISALVKAGLLKISYTEWFTNDSKYENIKRTSYYKDASHQAMFNGQTVDLGKGICRVTNLGKTFIKVCV